MKFIDELFNLYKNNLTGDPEDSILIIEDAIKDFDPKDVSKFIEDLSQEEKLEMLALYLYEKLQIKIMETGREHTKYIDDGKFFH